MHIEAKMLAKGSQESLWILPLVSHHMNISSAFLGDMIKYTAKISTSKLIQDLIG